MIWDTEKFSKEISAIKSLKNSGESLSRAELDSIKAKVLQTIRTEPAPVRARYFSAEKTHKLIRYIISVLIGVSLVGGTAFASGSAKPGDLLFPVKRVKEKVQIALAVSEESKAGLQAQFAQERLKELQELKAEAQGEKADKGDSNVSENATSSSSTVASELNDSEKVQIQAKHEAGVEVRQAVKALRGIQTKLEAKGDTESAAEVRDNIVQLQSRAQEQNVSTTEQENENDGQDQKEGNEEVKGASDIKVQLENDNTGHGEDRGGVKIKGDFGD